MILLLFITLLAQTWAEDGFEGILAGSAVESSGGFGSSATDLNLERCSGFGVWTSSNECECDSQHTGSACEYDTVLQRKVGRGSTGQATRRLTCHNGVIGCPGNADICSAAVCNCHAGWEGESCDVAAPPPAAKPAPASPPSSSGSSFDNAQADNARFAEVQRKLDAIVEQTNFISADGSFACPKSARAPSPCAHGGSLVRHGNKCTCSCKGDWSGATCGECPAQDCAHGGVWNPSTCACDCPAPWRSEDHCASCETKACGSHNGQGAFDPHTCQCTCNGLWKGDSCGQCSVDEGDVETIERLCGKKGFDVSTCACNAQCPHVKCANGGVLDPSSCTCMCNVAPDRYYAANTAADTGNLEASNEVHVASASSSSSADSFRFAARSTGGSGLQHRRRRRRHTSSKAAASHQRSLDHDIDISEAMALLEVERAQAQSSSYASAVAETAAVATAESGVGALSLSLPAAEQSVDAEAVASFEDNVDVHRSRSTAELASSSSRSRFAMGEQEPEVASAAGHDDSHSRSYWAGERCQVCLPPPSNPCRGGFVFSLGSCKCEPVCDLDMCSNGGSVVLLRPSKSAAEAAQRESASILLETVSESDSYSKQRVPALVPPGSKPVDKHAPAAAHDAHDAPAPVHVPVATKPSSSHSTTTTTDKLIATLVEDGKTVKPRIIGEQTSTASSSASSSAAAPSSSSSSAASLSSSASYVVTKDELDRLRAGLRCGCRCRNGWGGNRCDTRASGATAASAARSCLSILAVRPKAGSGRYWINPSGVAPLVNAFQVHCDMSPSAAAPASPAPGAPASSPAHTSASSASTGGWVTVAKIGPKLSSAFLDRATYVNGVSANKGTEYVLPCGRFTGLDGTYAAPLRRLPLDDLRARAAAGAAMGDSDPTAPLSIANGTGASHPLAASSPSSSASSPASLRHFIMRVQMGSIVDYFTASNSDINGRPWSLCDVLGSSQRHLWSPGFSERMMAERDASKLMVHGGLKAVIEGPPSPSPAPAAPPAAPAVAAAPADPTLAGLNTVAGKHMVTDGVYVPADSAPSSSSASSSSDGQAIPAAGGSTEDSQLLAASSLMRFSGAGNGAGAQESSSSSASASNPQGGFFGSLPAPAQPSLLTPASSGGLMASGYGASAGGVGSALGPGIESGAGLYYAQQQQQQQQQFQLEQQQRHLQQLQYQQQQYQQQQQQQYQQQQYQQQQAYALRGAAPQQQQQAPAAYYAQPQPVYQQPQQQYQYQQAQQQQQQPSVYSQQQYPAVVNQPNPGPVAPMPPIPPQLPPPYYTPSLALAGGSGGGYSMMLETERKVAGRRHASSRGGSKARRARGRAASSSRSRSDLEDNDYADDDTDSIEQRQHELEQHRFQRRQEAESESTHESDASTSSQAEESETAANPPSVTFSSTAGFSTLHDASQLWVRPAYVDLVANPQLEGVLGGSDRDWPVAWDGRRYLSIWGGNRGGCCHAKEPPHGHSSSSDSKAAASTPSSGAVSGAGGDAGSWGQEFTLSVIEVDPALYRLVKKRAAEGKLLAPGAAETPAVVVAPAPQSSKADKGKKSKKKSSKKAKGHSFSDAGMDVDADAEDAQEQEDGQEEQLDDFADNMDEGEVAEELEEQEQSARRSRDKHRFAAASHGRGRRAAKVTRRHAVARSSEEKDETDPLEAV